MNARKTSVHRIVHDLERVGLVRVKRESRPHLIERVE